MLSWNNASYSTPSEASLCQGCPGLQRSLGWAPSNNFPARERCSPRSCELHLMLCHPPLLLCPAGRRHPLGFPKAGVTCSALAARGQSRGTLVLAQRHLSCVPGRPGRRQVRISASWHKIFDKNQILWAA